MFLVDDDYTQDPATNKSIVWIIIETLSLERLRDVLASTITIRADYQDWLDERLLK